jgi:hypothetical protein
MKILFLSSFVLLSTAIVAQPKLVNQAIITTSTNIIAPEEEDVSQIQPQGEGRGGGFNFRNMLDGEIKTTYIKNDMVKTSFKSETAKGTIYRDNATKVTTTITEMMGNVSGMRSTDDDQVEMKKKMDSMMAERMKTDTNMKRRVARNVNFESSVAYTEETKKIAGYNCKKAYIITDKLLKKDSLAVWFTPELKFPNVASTGGLSSLGMMGNFMGGGALNFDKVNGFVMMYETKMGRGRIMEVKVTKIELEKEIAAKEFDIPKDIEIKSMKDMQGQGNVRMIMGGR